jgi:hypothetical protein
MLKLIPAGDFKQRFDGSTVQVLESQTSDKWLEMSFERFLETAYDGRELGRRLFIEFNEDTNEVAVA